jgi:DNA (cytosine-5)-methyltransferase 1
MSRVAVLRRRMQIGNAVPVGLGCAIAEHLAPLLLAQKNLHTPSTARVPGVRKLRRRLPAAA